MAKEGFPILFVCFFVSIAMFTLYYFTGVEVVLYLASVSVLGLVFIAFFFRDPQRKVPDGDGLIVAPADGKVVEIIEEPCDFLGAKAIRISIFLSIFNVHINRIPASGIVANTSYIVSVLGKLFGDHFRSW